MNPTEPEHDDTRPLTPEELAEEIEKTRAEIERAERLRRLEKIEDADGAWSVDVLLVREDETEPWHAKHATTWGARDVDQKTMGDRLAAAISEAERRANAACPPVAEQGVLFEEEDEMNETARALAERMRPSTEYVDGIGSTLVGLGSAYDSSKKKRVGTRKASDNPPKLFARDGKAMPWSDRERDRIPSSLTIESHRTSTGHHLEVLRGLFPARPIQSKIPPDFFAALLMKVAARSEADEIASAESGERPTLGVNIESENDIRELFGLTRQSVDATSDMKAAFAELLTTVQVMKDPKNTRAAYSVPFCLATRWPTVRGKTLPMSTMLARLARAQDTRRIEASEVAELNGEGAEEERADLPTTVEDVAAERDYAAKEGDESSSLLHGCRFIMNPDLLGDVRTAMLYHREGASKLLRGKTHTFARELFRVVFILLRKTPRMLAKDLEKVPAYLASTSDLRRVSNADLIKATGWRPEHPDQIRLPWRALLRFALFGRVMRDYRSKKGSAPFVEKAREEMKRLGRIGVFESWTEEEGAKDDPLGGVAVIKIPKPWVDWRREIHDRHEVHEAKKALEKGRTTPKAVEP
jgi:hypothetical protein